jgi:hypothetical protein
VLYKIDLDREHNFKNYDDVSVDLNVLPEFMVAIIL